MTHRVAVVTGGTRGIGRAYALHMAAQGYWVAVLDSSESALADIADAARNIVTYRCDLTDRSQIDVVLNTIASSLGGIDRLVHCAVEMPKGRLPEQPAESIQRLMTVNYGGTVNIIKAVLPLMQERAEGEIILLGSLGGYVPVQECGAYCASIAAVNTFVEILIEETRHSGVHVMLVCPPVDKTAPVAFHKAVKSIDRGLARRRHIVYPCAKAYWLALLRRLSPRLLMSALNTREKLAH